MTLPKQVWLRSRWGGVLAVVDDEELGAACVSACVGHAQHALVVELVFSVELAVDGVAGSSAADALRTSTLGHKPRNDAVELEAFVETFFGKLDEVGHRVGGVLLKKFHGHRSVVGVNLGVHAAKMHHPSKPTPIFRLRRTQGLTEGAISLLKPHIMLYLPASYPNV